MAEGVQESVSLESSVLAGRVLQEAGPTVEKLGPVVEKLGPVVEKLERRVSNVAAIQ